MARALIWIPLLPFLGFVLNGVFGRRLGDKAVSWIGCVAPLASFGITCAAWWHLTHNHEPLHQELFTWIGIGTGEGALSVPFAFLFDPLSSVMCLVVTGVGSLIHLYSTGYMKGDRGYPRYFSYLNLFMAFMLVLVLADNLLLLFVGWEGVGLCSYLLIGYWFEDNANCDAGRKAFIVNRIGDFGFLIALFLIFIWFQSFDPRVLNSADVLASLQANHPGVLLAIGLLLFVGATGKSAQIPLYVWLPDAMAGPTPVSALIHAATMVTSGVYLCCRLGPFFDVAQATAHVGTVIAGIGATTALLAALIALTQTDIKRVLAYSTVSQLGYMFFAVGVGAYGAALFHLVTHAFFKALLFLGSGSVILALHHEQDMRKMGGLRRRLPFTHLAFLTGALAISGLPPLSGFVSKDEVLYSGLARAWQHDGVPAWLFWGIAWITAGLTAFYMLRAMYMTFWGESRVAPEIADHVREPRGWMPLVLFLLSALSIVGGGLGWPEFLGGHNFIGHFSGFAHEPPPAAGGLHALEWTSAAISLMLALAGAVIALYFYGPGEHLRRTLAEGSGLGRRLVSLSRNKFYVDEVYQLLIIVPFHFFAYVLWILFDRLLIDAVLVNGSAMLTRSVAEWIRRMQTGYIPAYLLTFSCGVLVLLFLIIALAT